MQQMPGGGGIFLLEHADADNKEDGSDCREYGDPGEYGEPGDQGAGEFPHEYSSGTLLVSAAAQSEFKSLKKLEIGYLHSRLRAAED
jgi:hypothetical protein